jgi:hypothetical protein
MAKSKGKKRAEPRDDALPEPPREAGAEPPPAGRPILLVRRIVAVLLMATFLGSGVAYFVPPWAASREAGVPAWQQTGAVRLWRALGLWGKSRDAKRLAAPEGRLGGRVFEFTQRWSGYLDERLMPQTKFRDFTREEHIRYLLPNTNRRPIQPPPGPDRRPPVLVGYDLRPEQLTADELWAQVEHSGTIVLDEGHTIGQSFVTRFDYDLINIVALFVPPDVVMPEQGYSCVLYDSVEHRRELARADLAALTPVRFERWTGPEVGPLRALQFSFSRPPRLRYNRGAWPYLIEVSWQRPAGYEGPEPTFYYVDHEALPVGQMYVDGRIYSAGAHGGTCDLAFGVTATFTDVEGYEPVFGFGRAPLRGAWPPYFFAVRKDVLEMAGGIPPGETIEALFKRLNKVLLEQ